MWLRYCSITLTWLESAFSTQIIKTCLCFPGERWRARLQILAHGAMTTRNDHDYDDDMLITGVKIIIIITAVSPQMYNSPRCNYFCAVAEEKIPFRSSPQPIRLSRICFSGETSAASPFLPVGDKGAVYQPACSRAIRRPRWDHKSFNCFVQLGRKMLLLWLFYLLELTLKSYLSSVDSFVGGWLIWRRN